MALSTGQRRAVLALVAAGAAALVLAVAWPSGDDPSSLARGRTEGIRATPAGAARLREPSAPAQPAERAGAEAPAASAPSAPSPPEPDPTAPRTAADGPRLRGRVVDASTGDPVPAVRVVGEQSGAESRTDAAGRFASEAQIRADETLRVFDPAAGTHIRDVPPDRLVVEGDGGLLLRIAIGPTLLFHLPPGAAGPATDWEVRLVEEHADGNRIEHGWLRGRGEGSEGWVRYDNPLGPAPPNPAPRLLLEGRDGSGTLLAAGEGGTRVGLASTRVQLVVVERRGALTGRVVDQEGAPLGGLEVYAVPLGTRLAEAADAGVRPDRTETGEDGGFRLESLAPGPWRLSVDLGRATARASRDLQVVTGEQELDPLVLAVPTPVGDIRGVLRSSSGALPAYLHVHLTALDGRAEEIDTASGGGPFGAGFGLRGPRLEQEALVQELSFQFRDLPAGRYRIEVLDPSGARWSPAQIVEPPREDLLFERIADAEWADLRLEAVDAQDGTSLDVAYVRIERDGRELTTQRVASGQDGVRLTPAGNLRLFVWADGYAVAELAPAELRREGDGLRARVALDRGWSARLEVRDCEGELDVLDARGVRLWVARSRHPGVGGVRARLDGSTAGVSGDDGVLWLRAGRRPRDVAFEARAFAVLGSHRVERGAWQGEERFGVLWVLAP